MRTAAYLLGMVAFLVAWHVFLYKHSGGRAASPLWIAFGSTAAALLFVISGSLGYTLNRHDRFVSQTAWTGEIVWSQVWVGVAAAAVAAVLWHKALRSLRSGARV